MSDAGVSDPGVIGPGVSDPGEVRPAVDLVAVGRLGKAHGLRGDVTVEAWTDAPEQRFADGATLLRDGGAPLVVAHANHAGARLTVGFVGVEDRTAAEALRGTVVSVPAADRPAITDPDEFYDSELVGLRAETASGDRIGEVLDVVHGPGGDFLVLRVGAGGTVREQLVPFVTAIVPSVDVAGGLVVIDPPEGLLEL